ncbi:MAG: DUF1294 domain-containing protein [Prevotella sp.]|jgi:uncharacterized membrane protein YsdA (DUF1294 family)|uniref:DUF1294 domain-containing protein n=1 Tax=Parabacteroides leei TaxID=2939491 RepID=UPI0020179355|nr:DUF1294 domain-containing protein [Parabacteroides leei]MCL3854200.1 DUF1294 domain-containing protein [Parabacteroides leei]MDD4535304.1 DUF1294 domain-containing protein [Prevotella sp.]
MSTIEKIIIGYVIVINVITLMMYGIDKWKAKHSKWRIPEATLLIMAAVGGSIGAWMGIKLFHHKTLHKKFKYGVPGIFLIQLGIILFIYLKTNNLV